MTLPAAADPGIAWTGFELDGQVFALPHLDVERLLAAEPVTALPFAPACVEGVTSISGGIVPVLALPALLAPDRPRPTPSGAQFIVIRVSNRRFALRADRLLFVAAILPEDEPHWRGRPVIRLTAEALGLADLKPSLPPGGAPGAVADSRTAATGAAGATAGAGEMTVTVTAAGTLHGLPATSVVELLEDAAITRLPLTPPVVAGVVVLRGQPVLALSLARLLGGEPAAAERGHVVAAIGRSRLVLAVEAIGGLQRSHGPGADPGADRATLDLATLIPPRWLALAAEMSGTTTAAPVVSTDRRRFLCVSLGDRACALALAAVERILPPRAPVRLPAGAPAGVDGAVEFGGRIIPVTEGWRWLSLADGGPAAAHIVLQQDGERRVLAVNGVQRIVTIAPDDILPTGSHDPRIAGLGKAGGRSLEILSTEALLARGAAA